MAIGNEAVTEGARSVAIGDNARAQYLDSYANALNDGASGVAIGANTVAGFSSVAIGVDASTLDASHAVAVGPGALATGTSSLAVGSSASAIGWGASAFGRLSSASGNDSTAIGNRASAQGAGTVAIGTGSIADRDMTVSVGASGAERQIINVARGLLDTDAVNVSQLKSVANGFGGGAGWTAEGLFDNPTYTVAGGEQHTVGDALAALDANVNHAVLYDTLGDGAPDYSNVTLGHGHGQVGLHNVAEGDVSSTSTDAVNGAQLFATNQQVKTNAGNIGDLLTGHAGLVRQEDGNSPVTVAAASGGSLVTVNGAEGDRQIRGVAAGTQDDDAVNVSQLKDLAGQVGDVDTLAVKYDDAARHSVTLGGVGTTTPVAIHNVADGIAMHDAVNVSQLTNLQLTLQTQIGGLDMRMTTLENDNRTPPYLDGQSSGESIPANAGDTPGVALGYNSTAAGDNASAVGQNAQALGSYGMAVGNDAFAGSNNDTAIGGRATVAADNSVAVGTGSSITAAASNAVAVGAGSNVNAAYGTAVGQGAAVNASNAVAVGAGSVADRANTISVGAVGAERQITNVAAGTQATDAVNVSQLQNLQDWTAGKVDDLQQLINHNQRQANRGIASSAALVNNMPYVPGKVALSAGVAGYRGESAVGVAVSRWSSDGRVNLNAGVSAARGDVPIFRLGVGVVLGD